MISAILSRVRGAAAGPPEAGPAIPAYRPWQPPTDIELRLHEAKSRGDWDAYFHVLAKSWLFHAVPRAWADAHPGQFAYFPAWSAAPARQCVVLWTHGELPATTPDPVFIDRTLAQMAEGWGSPAWWLVINPGTPSEAYLTATPGDRAMWQRYHNAAPRGGHRHTLRTLAPGPQQGVLAFGLACGALLCVNNGSVWNTIHTWHGTGYHKERQRLADWWDITSPAQWAQTEEMLLSGRASHPAWEFALEIRHALARAYGGPITTGHWREGIARAIRARAEEAADRHETVPADPGAEILRVHQLLGRIERYEERFRADGLLRDGAYVTSVLAWDLGRASKMARWGLGARYCTVEEAERAIIRAGRMSHMSYASWEAFSAGYILGRCLHFDEESFGTWYEDMLTAHRILTTDPASPWRTIPWA
ncbi:DUF1266 domain-containing protein [Streptomyces specialis]|uniref:DUF1266 domain-containing protein n=1 Tax=Streptomyces specialis TaxID=498367 RepID=UPI000AC9010A|nr:DUF1266 domain-containing protein [Streptomyces specialis]